MHTLHKFKIATVDKKLILQLFFKLLEENGLVWELRSLRLDLIKLKTICIYFSHVGWSTKVKLNYSCIIIADVHLHGLYSLVDFFSLRAWTWSVWEDIYFDLTFELTYRLS